MIRADAVTQVSSTIPSGFRQLPDQSTWKIDNNASFVHYCQNETVHGWQFHEDDSDSAFPFDLFSGMTICCDMSSDIGSRKVDWNKYGMVYAGAQKNLGAAGVTVVIVREDLLGSPDADTPFVLDWTLYNESNNQYFNTPSTYPIYITGLNVAHMIKQGGLNYFTDLANLRAALLYGCIDQSNNFYFNVTDPKYRSRVNVPFRIRPDPTESIVSYTRLEELFIAQADQLGFKQLRGHGKFPGMRVSMYNAMPLEGVHNLIAFMQ
jgi:phosphoserine aminotransferase